MTSPKPLTIFAIESSCDETACAVVQKFSNESVVHVVAETTATSLSKHIETRGIVPEVAAREQLKVVLPVIQETLRKAAKLQSYKASETHSTFNSQLSTLNLIDFIAVTTGPGLIGSLLVGVETARTLSVAWNKPLIPVNHVLAHPYANFISEIPSHKFQNPINTSDDPHSTLHFPLLSWVISGGHTDLYYMESHQKITRLGGTVDDSAGECFDKCARLLGFDYPGGPNIEKLASEFKNSKLEIRNLSPLPRPLLHSKDFKLSFSGLKTAFLREFENSTLHSPPSTFQHSQLAHELQSAITDVIVKKTELALEKYPQTKGLMVSGGVSANQFLTNALKQLTVNFELSTLSFHSPPLALCTDNAVMIGSFACFHPELAIDWKNIVVKP